VRRKKESLETMIAASTNGVQVVVFDPERNGYETWAEVDVKRNEDGSPKNVHTTSAELRETAEMLEKAADKMMELEE